MKTFLLKIGTGAETSIETSNVFIEETPSPYRDHSRFFDNDSINAWISKFADLTLPDRIELFTGSPEQVQRMTRECLEDGELIELDQSVTPNSHLHRSKPTDVARLPERTVICTPNKEDAGPTNRWMTPEEGYSLATQTIRGSMKGRTLYVIPYHKGPLGGSRPALGIQLTDSRYVALNIEKMYENGLGVVNLLNQDKPFSFAQHAKVEVDPKGTWILHFVDDNKIISFNSGYGGNAILPKKADALRLDSVRGIKEGFYAEHMAIIEVTAPWGKKYTVQFALPSACGKTNNAMIQPPKSKEFEGWSSRTIGDDLVRYFPHPDGYFHSVNPEKGYFGVAPGTSKKTNPYMFNAIQADTIYTNVMTFTNRNGKLEVYWEGKDGVPPKEGIAWDGTPIKLVYVDESGKHMEPPESDWLRARIKRTIDGQKLKAVYVSKQTGEVKLAAHANSRFTTPASRNSILSPNFTNPDGIPLHIIIFGARRSNTVPLFYKARNWQHGVFMGASMFTEQTAAVAGTVGTLRWDPNAMVDFLGMNVGDYSDHWLDAPNLVKNLPEIYFMNVFRKDKNGKFIFPGFHWNFALVKWAIESYEKKVEARETALGLMPRFEDLALKGTKLSQAALEQAFHIDADEWFQELPRIYDHFTKVGKRMPEPMFEELAKLRQRIYGV